MTLQDLPVISEDFKVLVRVRRGRWRVGVQNRVRILAALRGYWAQGVSPVPKVLGFDIGIDPSQVVRHLRFLEERGALVRRRKRQAAGIMIYVDQPAS